MNKFFLIVFFCATLFSHDIVIKESANSVDTTIQKIKKIVTKKGLTVFSVVDHQANAGKIGMRMREAKLIIFGNPKTGTKLMQKEILTGLDLPMKIFVYQDKDKKVKIAYRNGSWLLKEHPLLQKKLVLKIDKALDKITDKAIQ